MTTARIIAMAWVAAAIVAVFAAPSGVVRPDVAFDAAPTAQQSGGADWAQLGWGGGEGVRVGHINIAPHLPGWGTRYR